MSIIYKEATKIFRKLCISHQDHKEAYAHIYIPSIIHPFRNQITHEPSSSSSLVKEVLQPVCLKIKDTHSQAK